MRYLPDKKSKISPGFPALATVRIAPKICPGQPHTMYSECSRLHPNQFTFGGVIAQRVNTVKTRPSVSNIRLKPSFEPNNKVSKSYQCKSVPFAQHYAQIQVPIVKKIMLVTGIITHYQHLRTGHTIHVNTTNNQRICDILLILAQKESTKKDDKTTLTYIKQHKKVLR